MTDQFLKNTNTYVLTDEQRRLLDKKNYNQRKFKSNEILSEQGNSTVLWTKNLKNQICLTYSNFRQIDSILARIYENDKDFLSSIVVCA